MDTAIKMEKVAPTPIRIRPTVRVRLDAYLKRNPHVSKTDLLNDGLELELARRETMEVQKASAA